MPIETELWSFARVLATLGWEVYIRTEDALLANTRTSDATVRIVYNSPDRWFFRGDQLLAQHPPIIHESLSTAEILEILSEYAPGGEGTIKDTRA